MSAIQHNANATQIVLPIQMIDHMILSKPCIFYLVLKVMLFLFKLFGFNVNKSICVFDVYDLTQAVLIVPIFFWSYNPPKTHSGYRLWDFEVEGGGGGCCHWLCWWIGLNTGVSKISCPDIDTILLSSPQVLRLMPIFY